MTGTSSFEFDEDDPEAPWNRSPVEGLPEAITPGRIKVQLWFYLGGDEPMAHDVIFKWSGDSEATWFYDISDDNPGLSVMSSAPFYGTASWKTNAAVLITVDPSDFGDADELIIPNSAPDQDALGKPQTWVDLAEKIAGICNSLMMDE